MSRVRVRATREETRERLFEAAAEVFAEQGIGAASVEAITSAAGLTRGAFYSNFASKDDLIAAMLADHVAQTTRRHMELLARHRDPRDFVAALYAVDRSGQDPLGRSPLLHLELLLHAARTEARAGSGVGSGAGSGAASGSGVESGLESGVGSGAESGAGPGTADRSGALWDLQARRKLVADIVAGTGLAGLGDGLFDPDQLAAMLLALEDGFRLHRLIDPEATPADSYLRSLSMLQEVLLRAAG
jgi:AcrR family transcriptional regulator